MSQDHKLFIGGSFDALWDGASEHWFGNTCASAWVLESVAAVLVPSRAYGFFLKSKLLEREMPCAGIQFWTPGECREALVARLKHRPVAGVREHLHLLLAAAAEQESTAIGRSVARDPSGLMRALDALSAAGLPWASLPYPSLLPIVDRFRKSMDRLGWTTVQHVDRLLLQDVEALLRSAAQMKEGASQKRLYISEKTAVDRLLIIGFDGAHWPFWNLLQAAVGASQESTVCLTSPRYKSEQLDQIWIGSWEHLHGEAEPVQEETAHGPFAALAERMENPDGGADIAHPSLIHFGHDLREQARAAAARAITFLADETCTRLGILVPAYGALSREIAAELKRNDIAFNDTLGCNAPPLPGDEAWRAWMNLQAAPELESLVEFLRQTETPLPFEDMVNSLVRAAGEVLVHDLPVLAAYLKDATDKKDRAVGLWLSGFVYLPDRGALREFLSVLPERAEFVKRAVGEIPEALAGPISKSTFLAWLDQLTNTPLRHRDPASTHPFARVHLLKYAHAEGQIWSHLVLTGLNESIWPPRQEPAPFLSDARIDVFNRDAVQQGAQGEGHLTVKPERAYLLGPAQQRALYQRQFYNLIESATHGLCLTASLTDEADPSRRLLPSEYLTYLYYVQHGEPLSDEHASEIQEATAAWLKKLEPAQAVPTIAATRDAFLARRDSLLPFGPFEFALSKAPTLQPRISCKAWEDIVRAPAIQWLNFFCDVRCLDLDPTDDGQAIRRGSWVHRWLSRAFSAEGHGGITVPWPNPSVLPGRVDTAAEETAVRIAKAFAAARRPVPDRWRASWHDAVWATRRFTAQLQSVAGWPRVAMEISLPEPLIAEGLRLHGRIDLLFLRGESECWIVDYKTGSAKPLTPKNLLTNIENGNGVQLSLYVLAQRARGMTDIAASLLTPNARAEPQISLTDVEACNHVWQALRGMQDSGIFGMREELRPEFGVGPTFPIATLAIDDDVLAAKWELTHPQLVRVEEE